jgi:hypothetical protein
MGLKGMVTAGRVARGRGGRAGDASEPGADGPREPRAPPLAPGRGGPAGGAWAGPSTTATKDPTTLSSPSGLGHQAMPGCPRGTHGVKAAPAPLAPEAWVPA